VVAFARVGGIRLASREVSVPLVTVRRFELTRTRLFFSGSLHPTNPRFDYDHNTIDLSKLKKIVVQLDSEKGPSLDTLLEKHQQKLIKRGKDKGFPGYHFAPGLGFRCLDCHSYDATMSREVFQWHSLTKWVFWFLSGF